MKAALRRCPGGPTRHVTVTSLLLDLSLLRLLLTVFDTVLGAPFRTSARWASTTWHLALALRRFVLRFLGYMAAAPQSRALRHLGGIAVDVRRWHLAAGGRQRPRLPRPAALFRPSR